MLKRRGIWVLFAALMVCFTLIGADCGKTSRKVVKKGEKENNKWKKTKFVLDSVAADSKVKENIKVVERLYMEENGIVKVEYRLENNSRKTMQIECKIRFFDQHDSEIEDALSFWHPYPAYPGEKISISANSPKPGACRAELTYRLAKEYNKY